MRTPVFHVGFPKTGSTFLQWKVFPYINNVDYLGLYPKNGPQPEDGTKIKWLADKSLKPFYKELFYKDEINFNLQKTQTLLSEILDKSNKDTPLFSHEAGVGILYSYPDAAVKARRLRDVFGNELKVIIIIREQLGFLESQYRDHPFSPTDLINGRPLCFDKWLEEAMSMNFFSRTVIVRNRSIVDFYQ